MAIDRAKFFAGIRQGPFPGTLSAEAVSGITAILDEWERRGLTDLRWLAYMLATVLAECGKNMLPVREGFARSDAAARSYVASKHYKYAKVEGGHVYYGRGLVQLTWLDNYRKMSTITGIDLVNNPDRALEPPVAAKIMFEGMIRGTFTGKKLGDYFSTGTDWKNARRIINGLDRADEIAGYAKQFHADLVAADTATATAPVSLPVPPASPKSTQDKKEGAGILVGGGGLTAALYAVWGNWAFKAALFIAVAAALYWFVVRPIIRRYWALDEIEGGLWTRLRLALKGVKTKLFAMLLGIAGVALPALSWVSDAGDLSAFLPDIMGIPASTYQYGIFALVGWAVNTLRNATTTAVGQTDMALATVPAPPLVPDMPKSDPSTDDLIKIIKAKRKPKPAKKAKRKKRSKVKA